MERWRKIRRNVAVLVSKLGLLAAPLVILLLIEAFVLPCDFFAFRCWEALSVRSLKWAFPGPFYPNQTLTRSETGDLSPGTTYGIPRQVTWVTDDHGFRNRTSRPANQLDVVIIGDSFIAGTGLTQSDILPEVLEREHGLKSYGYAPSNMKHFVRDPRFATQLPKVVVVAMVERSFVRLSSTKTSMSEARQWLESLGPRYEGMFSSMDRLCAPSLPAFTQARLRPEPRHPITSKDHPGYLFLASQKNESTVQPGIRKRYAALIKEYHRYITERGSRFIFLPIPDKEFIYAGALGVDHWPTLIPELIQDLKAEGISVIDTPHEFLIAHSESPDVPLYQPDDTHWGAAAVQIAARLIHKELERSAVTQTAAR